MRKLIKLWWRWVLDTHSIKLLVMDCDGTLTDGDVRNRKFNVKDGYGLKNLNIEKAIITMYDDEALRDFAKRTGINHISIGYEDKLIALNELMLKYKITYDEICYVGDDLNDLCCIEKVGIGIAVRDAVSQVKKKADYVTRKKGGAGAIREVIELLKE